MPKPYFSDKQNTIPEMLRVDHAGEYGAKRIYDGQIKFIKDLKSLKLIQDMKTQEEVHLQYFSDQLKYRKVRPTALLPIWNIGGYLLGATSGIAGTKTAMLVTKAVEEVIEKHYANQINDLRHIDHESELLESITKFQQDELEHKHIADNAESLHPVLENVISVSVKTLCHIAIFLSKKL